MKYTTTSMLFLLGLSVGTTLADNAVENPRGGPSTNWIMRRESDSDLSDTLLQGKSRLPTAETLRHLFQQEGFFTRDGRFVKKIAFPTQVTVNFGNLPVPASSGDNTRTIEVNSVPNGGENINGNGAHEGSIFVDGSQVFGTPSATETIDSRHHIERTNGGRLTQKRPIKDKLHRRHHHGQHRTSKFAEPTSGGHVHTDNPANPTKTQTHTHVPVPAATSTGQRPGNMPV